VLIAQIDIPHHQMFVVILHCFTPSRSMLLLNLGYLIDSRQVVDRIQVRGRSRAALSKEY
jgi:hypothetical protein